MIIGDLFSIASDVGLVEIHDTSIRQGDTLTLGRAIIVIENPKRLQLLPDYDSPQEPETSDGNQKRMDHESVGIYANLHITYFLVIGLHLMDPSTQTHLIDLP